MIEESLGLNQAKSKNNIAENSVAPGHDTHNHDIFVCLRSLFGLFLWYGRGILTTSAYLA